jgi:HAD superfamily hydrolase (TIGR01509 family)
MISAVIWDVDGTIAETERDGHLRAFNQAFSDAGLAWRWSLEQYRTLLRVSGGQERLLHFMSSDATACSLSLFERTHLAQGLHKRKTELYAQLANDGRIGMRPGVARLMHECEQNGVQMGIATTTSRANLDALFPRLLGQHWQDRFVSIVTAQEAPRKKPDPMAYALALLDLNTPPGRVIAVEDSPQGIQAAIAAHLPVLHTTSEFFPAEPGGMQANANCADLDSAVTSPSGASYGVFVNLATLERILEQAECEQVGTGLCN